MSNPQEHIYIDYLNYDWNAFLEFQEGLKEILDGYLQNLKEQDPSITSIPAVDRQQLVDQAKSFFYCKETGNIINLDDYLQWKYHNGSKYDRNQKISEITDDSIEKVAEIEPAQKISDEPALKGTEEPTVSKEATDSNAPPYSSNYQELVELIISGKPVPGTKDIPDTVFTEKSSKSQAKPRVKPWEKAQKAQDVAEQ